MVIATNEPMLLTKIEERIDELENLRLMWLDRFLFLLNQVHMERILKIG